MHPPSTNELLGYPPDARLLILNADDFGMYEAINQGIFETLSNGIVRSATIMAPCPGAAHALQMLKTRPDIDVGVHLTVICDLFDFTYGPLAPADAVPSLIDTTGAFYHDERIPAFLAAVKLDELEREFRAQIDDVLAAGVRPTHLDWHCLHSGGRPDIFAMTLRLAREYGLALRVAQRPLNLSLQAQGLPTADNDLVDSFRIPTEGKAARYARMLRELPAGLTEWAVHPSVATPASRTFDDGWQVRRADYEFLVSPEARAIVEAEGIILLSYRPLQQVWREARDTTGST